MADFTAPAGPPPPKVPEGWVARWNDQYKEWFYVNTYTKQSQWDKPTEPAINPHHEAPAGAPPGYSPGSGPAPTDAKTNPFASNTHTNDPYAPGSSGFRAPDEDADARLARQLQEEENARAGGHGGGSGGAAQSYHNSGTPVPSASHSPYPDHLPPRSSGGTPADKAKGLLGKFFGNKNKAHGSSGGGLGSFLGSSSHGGGHAPYQQQQYGGGYGGHQPQQGYYGSPSPFGQHGGGYGAPQHGYGGYPGGHGGHGGGFPGGFGGGGHGYGGHPPKKSGGGMGMAGGAALGVGAGLVGGAIIADQIQDEQQESYAEGYEDGAGGDDFDGGGDF